tara:strand:+ start:407 stop:559 length:153 start_codon:yes stop_codon:yes gene_type:complete
MNAVEFVFALIAVFGSTTVILGWTTFVYSLEENEESKSKINNNYLKMIVK